MPGKCIRCFITSKARRKKDQGFLTWKYVCWVELCPQKRNAEVLTPGTYDYDIIYSLSRCKHVKMRSFGWVLTQYDWCPCEKRQQRPWDHLKTRWHRGKTARCRQRQRQTGVMPLQEHTGSPETGRGCPPEAEGSMACQHPDFGLLASRIIRQSISIVLSHPVCGTLSWQPKEINKDGTRRC